MTAVEMISYTSHSAYFKTGIVIDHVRGVTYEEPKCLRYVTGLYSTRGFTCSEETRARLRNNMNVPTATGII